MKEGTVSDHATDDQAAEETMETQKGWVTQQVMSQPLALALLIWAGDISLPGGKENPGAPAATFLSINRLSLSSQVSPGSKASPAIPSVGLTPWSLLFLVGEKVTTLLHPVPRGSHIFSCTGGGTTLGRGVPTGRLRCSEQK